MPTLETTVNGLKLPFKAAISRGGQQGGDATITDWKINSGLKAEDLSKQP